MSFLPQDVLDEIWDLIESVSEGFPFYSLSVLFLLFRNFSVAISVSPDVCFILVLILISIFLR